MNSNIYIIYYIIHSAFDFHAKSFIKASNKDHAGEVFLKKIKKDLKKISISNIRIYHLNKNKYKGRVLSDKEWELILEKSYPNTKHKLYKISKDSWFAPNKSDNRDSQGRFSTNNTPWNKGLRISFEKRNENGKFCPARNKLGQFQSGIKYQIIGSNNMI